MKRLTPIKKLIKSIKFFTSMYVLVKGSMFKFYSTKKILETSQVPLIIVLKLGIYVMIFHFFPVQTTFLENLLKRYRGSYSSH